MKRKITLLSTIILASINMFGANYFWVGGSGSWSDFSTHWATTSGGSVFYTQVPQSTDNVFFDALSFSAAGQTVTIDQPIVQCANMKWTGVAKTPTFYGDYTNTLKIYGSLTLATGMTFNFAGPISFEATTAGQTITSAGNLINTSLTFNGIGGSWTLQDALSTGWIFLNNGTLTTNNQTVNAYAFTSTTSSSRTLNMGSSTFNLSFYGSIWEINATGMTMNAGTSTIRGIATSGGSQDFYGAGFTYNDIFFTGTQTGKINGNSTIHDVTFAADGYIQGNCNFHNVTFNANAFLTTNSSYNSVTINQNADISSSNTFNSLTLTPGYTYTLTNSTTQTINSSLTANGNCGALIQIQSSTSGRQAAIAKAAGTVAISYVTLKDISTTGGATFTASNANDLGNNTGWTINTLASKNLYWIGNSGNWNDGNHWSTTSGGAPAGCSPTPKDNVFFDAHSFPLAGQTVTVNVPTAYVNNMTWTGVTNTPTFYGDYSSTLKVYGSLTLAAGMIFNFSGDLYFEATNSQTITTAGNLINTSLTFNGIGGSWTLQDNLSCSYWIYLNNGILNTNNKTINAYAFSSTTANSRTLNMGSSVFNLSFNGFIWEINSTGMTINAGTSTINGIGVSGGEQDFYGGGFTYNNIYFIGAALGKVLDGNNIHDVTFASDGYIQGGNFHDVSFAANAVLFNNNNCNNVVIHKNGDIYDNNNFNNLTLTPGYTYTLTSGTTQTINSSLTATGNCGGLIEISSSIEGSQATISKSSGTVSLSYITLKDINLTGGALFTALNANDLGNNIGLIISTLVPKNLYWVGNGGNWSDGNHWSNTSGGVPTGCSPTPKDNAFFDAHSFSLTGQTVTIDVPTATTNNMTWTGVTNAPTLYGDYSNTLKVYGSLALAAGMTLNYTGDFIFEASTTGQTITSAGIPINTSLTFDGIGGSWTLQDALTSNYWIYLNNGTLTTNNKTVNAYAFNSTTANSRTLNMGSSVFNLSFNGLIWDVNPTGMTINAGTSTINGTGTSGGEQDFNGGGFTYNNIFFIGSALGKIIDSNTINDVSFASDGFIQGGNFHDVTFSANAILYNDNVCNNVTIAKDGDILGSNTFNNLKFSPGYAYTLTAGETQTIINGGNICAQGTGALPIRIQSSSVGVPSTISKANGTICWDYVRISDIAAVGGATFNAGLAPTNSQDMGGNTGFSYTGGCTITGCTPCIPPSITTNPTNVNVCSGNSAVFTATAFGTGLTYQWQVKQGTAGFTNISNTSIYSGVTTGTLNISAAANGLNNYQYRCIVTGTCSPAVTSAAAILTVNPLPVATSSVNTSTVTISATGGTTPYTGTGAFTGLTSGTYSYIVTDAKGCSSHTTATVSVSAVDHTPPTANCKNATVTLVNGTATITASTINNGSYDNVGIASITVSPTTFTCANIGANTITLTVKDYSGNVSTCHSTLTVIGSIPTVSISQGALPGFCQGSSIALNATASAGVTYLWNSGETSSSKNVTTSGTSSVTVTNANGCKATATYTATCNSANLFSSYTIITKNEADFENYSFVQSGGVAATASNGEIDVQNHSSITGNGTFAKAHSISVNYSSTVTNKTNTAAVITLPPYKTNPYCQSNSGNCHHICSNPRNCNHHCDGNSQNCSHSNKNKCQGSNTNVTFNDSIYSQITIGDNSTATFTQPVVYIKSLTTGSHTKIVFTGCTEIKVCGDINLDDYTIFNNDAKNVVIYCDGDVQIGKGNFFTGSIYAKGQITTNGSSCATVSMKGLFIAQEVESSYTTWNWNTVYTSCNAKRSFMITDDNSDNGQTSTETLSGISAIVYPNPSMDNFNLEITSEDKTPAIIRIYDITGREVFIKNDVEIDTKLNFGNELKAGIYMLTISQGSENKTLRMIKQNN